MGKGLSLNVYTQANAGVIRNSDGAFFSKIGAGVGLDVEANFDGKNSLIYGANGSAGTAVSTNAYVGYKRALGNNSNLVFTGNFSYDKSLTKTDSYNVHIDNNATVNGKKYQLDLINKNESWKPDNMQYGGRVAFNKETKWGGYEVGAEVGYMTNSSPEFHKAGGSKTTLDFADGKKYDIASEYEYGRERSEGMYGAINGKIHANLNKSKSLQIFGEGNLGANVHKVEVGIKYNIFKK